jgi:hypothetical protein
MNAHNASRIEASSTRTLQPETNPSQSILVVDQPEVRQPDFKVVKGYGYQRFAGYDKKVLHTNNTVELQWKMLLPMFLSMLLFASHHDLRANAVYQEME